MKIHDVEQGTPEWHKARLGIPTASCFDKIITPTGLASKSAEGYGRQLLAEIMTGKIADTYKNDHMERGNELEPDAAAFYDFQRETQSVKVGFCTNDSGTFGASPDRLIGNDGLLEIKCPAPQTHIGYLLGDKMDMGYYPQVQGQLLVTGRAWCDWMSYHPEMPPVIMRIERDNAYLAKLSSALAIFTASLISQKKELIDKGYLKV